MYVKEKILSLSSTVSPLPKNLTITKQNDENVIISSAHKNCFNIMVTNNRFENDSNTKEIIIEDNKEANYPKDYIIQLKWLVFNETTLLIVVLPKSVKFFSKENHLLFNYENISESEQNQDNSYSGGIAALVRHSVVFIGANNGSIIKFNVNKENQISIDKSLIVSKHIRPITDLVSDKEERLISCDNSGKICVWDYNNDKKQLDEQATFNGFHDSSCNCLALFDKWLCAGYGSGHIRIFDVLMKSLVCEISAHSKWITHLDIASKPGFVLSTSEDSFVRIWQICEQNDSIKVCHRFSESIANHMLFGGAFVDSSGQSFCVAGYDSTELYCFRSETNTF